jgi:hypothetical protein
MWVRQSLTHLSKHWPAEIAPQVPVVAYFPPGIGEQNTAHAMGIVPLHVLMHLLEEAGYTPDPAIQISIRTEREVAL